jgi:uncharacterized protein YecT (DUF1311 family)
MDRVTAAGYVVALALMSGRASADTASNTDPCAAARNQLELTECAVQQYKKADANLNRAYKVLLISLDQEHQVKLKAAQRAWIASRDADCDLEASQALHGSMEGQLRYMCLEDEAAARIKSLDTFREILKDFIQ